MVEEVKEIKERKSPYSLEAEMSVLGAMMLDAKALVTGFEMLKRDDFYLDSHRRIFSVLSDLFEQKKTVDILTVKEELQRRGELERVGGASYLATLVDSVITPALIEQHANIVLEKSIYRKVISVVTRVLEEAYREYLPADELLDLAEQRILDIREKRIKSPFLKISDLVKDIFANINEMMLHKRRITGIPTGYTDLDILTSGFQPGDLVVLASRPTMGKTSFALNILRYLGVEKGIPSAIFSLEMSKDQIVLRLLCMEARVNAQKVRTGYISKKEIPKLTEAVHRLRNAPIYIDDTPAIELLELRAKARRIVKEAGVQFIVVDYLQLVQGPRDTENRQQEISAISRSLKALAKELNIPIMAVSQLSRAVEQRHDKRPQLSDLRESGAIEQDADTVLFIHRPELYDDSPEVKNLAEIIIGKQRNGPVGTVKLSFLKDYMRFEQFAYEEEFEEEELGF
jgi:replicative DNA helicase